MSVFRGPRDPGVDYFDDYTGGTNDDGGVFEGGGIKDYENLRESVGPDGVKIRINCRKCNKGHDLTIEWQELFVVGSNGPGKTMLPPSGWQYSENNGTLYPANVHCSKCREPLCPQVTPDEARQRVNDAVSRNLIPMGQAKAWADEVSAWRARNG